MAGIVLAGTVARTEPAGPGEFEGSGDLGETPKKGSVDYDAAAGEYRVTGGGANVWFDTDAFYFVWKRMPAENVVVSADVKFVGTGAVAHRKAVLMFRQDLAPNSAYADIALHGDGLTSLQYRTATGEKTLEARLDLSGPTHLEIRRAGSRFTISARKASGEAATAGPVEVNLHDAVYVGIGVCSHDANVLETAIFSNVKIGAPAQ